MVPGSFPSSTLGRGDISWKDKKKVRDDVERASIVIRYGQTEAAADVSPASAELGRAPCLVLLEGKQSPDSQEAQKPALLSAFAWNGSPSKGAASWLSPAPAPQTAPPPASPSFSPSALRTSIKENHPFSQTASDCLY